MKQFIKSQFFFQILSSISMIGIFHGKRDVWGTAAFILFLITNLIIAYNQEAKARRLQR